MNKLREKVLSKFLLMLLIAGLCTFNFSHNTTIALCDDVEDSCCTSDCSDSHTSLNETSAYELSETISGDCLCIVELHGEKIFGEKSLIHTNTSGSTNNSYNINFAKAADFTAADNIKFSNSFIKPPDKSSYILKDVYLFNSILRI